MSTAYLSFGTKLHADLAGGSSYSELTDVKEITPTYNPKYVEVDTTPLAPSTAIRSLKRGMGKPGSWSFKQFWTKAREAALDTPYASGVSVSWKVTKPDNSNPALAAKDVFTGFITNTYLDGTGSADDPLMIVVEVQADSDVTSS